MPRLSFSSGLARWGPFLVALTFWTVGSVHRSLWEDEFHSLYHARAPDLVALLESVRSDNHPPLSFLLIQASRALFGENELALRLPSLLVGLILFPVFTRLARRLEDPFARALAPWLAAASSYLFWIVSAARMYALLALATLGLVESLVSALDGKRSRWWIALWIAVGLHTHYHFFHHLTIVGLACLFLAWRVPECRAGLRALVLPGLLGVALFVPWTVYGFARQLGTGDPPTSAYRGLSVWVQSYAHFLFINPGLKGRAIRSAILVPGSALGAVLGVLGTLRIARDYRSRRVPAFAVLLFAVGLVAPTWIYLSSLVHARSGFHLKYLASFAAPVLLIVAAGAGGAAWRRALGVLLLAAMLVVTGVNAASRGRMDIHGAVDFILDRAQAGDAVMCRPWWFRDPQNSPTDFGWYGERLGAGRVKPAEIPTARVSDALAHPRVWVIHSSAYPARVLLTLGEVFAGFESFVLGPEITVLLYSNPRTDEAPGR
jgi:4-amino-4-deoxy-L-arabinose transferase-like glycosyltransferase